jgi:hypothetical protein
MPIRRKTRKRGGTKPPSGIPPPPPYNRSPPPYSTLSSGPSSSVPASNDVIPSSTTPIASAAASSNLPSFNQPPPYTPDSRVIETQTNAPSVSHVETQTNNTNRSITNITEDQLLQHYTSVYESITSKDDAIESTALFKEHLQMIRNPLAIYVIADKYTTKNSSVTPYRPSIAVVIHSYVITRNDIYHVDILYADNGAEIKHYQEQYDFGKSKRNYISKSFEIVYHFEKPLDPCSIRMFRSFSSYSIIGNMIDSISGYAGSVRCTSNCILQWELTKQFIALCRDIPGQKKGYWTIHPQLQ